MKANPFVRPAAGLAAVLFASLAASSAAAQWWKFGFGCRGDGCVARDQVKERAGREFDALRDKIEVDHKDSPNKGLYISQVKETEKRFNSQADAVLKKEKYAEWEFRYIGERVTYVIIPTIEKAVVTAAALPAAEAPSLFKAAADDSKALAADHLRQFVNRNRTDIESSAVPAGPAQTAADAPADPAVGEQQAAAIEPVSPPAHATTDSVSPLHEAAQVGFNAGQSSLRLLQGARHSGPRPTAEQLVAASDVVRLAEASANYVKSPPKPGEEPGGDGSGNGTGTGGAGTGGTGTGGNPRPRPRPRPGNTTPSSPGDSLIDAITSPAGVSQLYATNGLQALEGRNYRDAFNMSQRALAIDPTNRSAMEVYHAAKGRMDGVAAGAATLAAAKEGANAFARGPMDAGAFGGAAPSPAIGAAAASGAARVSGDQAFAAASAAMGLKDSAGALAVLDKALAEYPDNPRLLHQRAQIHQSLGQWDKAIADADAGLALAPGNGPLLLVKAFALNRAKRYKDALASSELLVAANPRSAYAFANRAHAWAGLGDREAMMADLRQAAALDPRFAQTLAEAATLQLPSDQDVMFLFPNEAPRGKNAAPASTSSGKGKSFSVVVGAGVVGGLLLALGLLSTVLAPLKNTVVSVFTRARRTGPAATATASTARPATAAATAGGLIRGQYEIARQIGAGGMGMVYEGTDRSLGRRVAIKKMRDELRLNPRERDRFVIEAKTVASLHHPNIVDIYAIAEEGEDVYLVFEFVDGKTVHDLVQVKGRLDAPEAVRLTRAMADALTYAHAHGVIHRDMKPSNVMLTSAGQVKVMDFGIARMAKDALTRYSMTNTVVGTPPYMAPEQEQGVVRKESDVYSLAVCAYEMLTGKLPFVGIGAGMLMNKINMSYIPPSRSIAGLPEGLDEVFLKAFQADPDRRYRTPQEFVVALAAAAGAGSRTA